MLVLLAEIELPSDTYYAANEIYCSKNTDVLLNELFQDRLKSVTSEQAVSYAFWNRTGPEQAVRSVELYNGDGALDAWVDYSWKGKQVLLKTVERYGAHDDAVIRATLFVSSIEVPNSDTIRLVCRSYLETFNKTTSTQYSTAITNEQYRRKPKPYCLGNVRWMNPINSRLNDSSGSTRAVNDVADDYFESIVELRSQGVYQNESQTPLVTNASPTYFVIQDTDGFGYLFREQEYRHAVEINGQVRRDANIITNPTLLVSIADYTAHISGSNTVTWNIAGSVTIVSDGTDDTFLYQNLTLVTGNIYQVAIGITTSSGVSTLATFDGATFGGIRSVDTINGKMIVATHTCVGTETAFAYGFQSGASGSAQIYSFNVYPVTRIDTITEVLRFLAVTRGELSTSDLDLATCDTLQAETDYSISFCNNGNDVTAAELLRKLEMSFGISFYSDADGVITPVRLQEPAVSADLDIVEADVDDLQFDVDLAPGLSSKIYYGRNYNPHSVDDVAGIPPTSTAAVLLRTEMQDEVKIAETTETLHAMYLEAEEREPLDSLLRYLVDAEAEIDRICGLYTTPRAFYTLRIYVTDATPYTLAPGQTVNLTHSRYGLSGGVNLLVVYVRFVFLENRIDLVLWG